MKNAMRLFAAVALFLSGASGGEVPNGGYCIENQCFTVFQDVSGFAEAQDTCKGLGGHLMTVRSSESHDILANLLANSTGDFWIGLHLPEGSPDSTDEMRGFQWVIEDSNSDFSAWATDWDSSCSPCCVSVSKGSGFKWTPKDCLSDENGFLCEHGVSETCTRLADVAQPVTYVTPFGFGGEELPSLPHGSVATQRTSGIKHVCYSGRWQQGPWSCEIKDGGCEHKCTVSDTKGPFCSCPPGKTVNSTNHVTCETDAHDPCLPLRCDHTCQSDGESHECVCDRGFALGEDKRSCHDVDECADSRQCPWENFRCVNTNGGFECACRPGYAKAARDRCVDQDECASAPCEHTCVNTPGSYRCRCYSGYRVDPKSPNNCVLYCDTEECPAECDPNDESQCNCPRGYIGEERDEGMVCLDIDECESEQCDQGCKNTFGSFVCTCKPGFRLVDEVSCVEIEGYTEPPTTPALPPPEPTKKPSAVSVGGLVGIILCTAFVIVLVVFLVHHTFNRRDKTESAGELKAPEGETHGLERVATD